MKNSRYREEVMCLPLGQGKAWRYFYLLLLLTALTLALCITAPLPVRAEQNAGDNGGPQITYPSQVFMYPRQGQSPMQQDRDHYECHIWAMGQTGFDPSVPPLPIRRPVRVEPVPPIGYDTFSLGFTGALLGAILGGYHHSGEGALIGGAIGAMTGVVSDSARAQAARRIEADRERRNRERDDQVDDRAAAYRRAMGACLEGRGYSVK
jgi:hypothetical protein